MWHQTLTRVRCIFTHAAARRMDESIGSVETLLIANKARPCILSCGPLCIRHERGTAGTRRANSVPSGHRAAVGAAQGSGWRLETRGHTSANSLRDVGPAVAAHMRARTIGRSVQWMQDRMGYYVDVRPTLSRGVARQRACSTARRLHRPPRR